MTPVFKSVPLRLSLIQLLVLDRMIECQAFSRFPLQFQRAAAFAPCESLIAISSAESPNNEDDEEAAAAAPISPPAPVSNPIPQRSLDPLVSSLIRTDNGPPRNRNNPTLDLPIAGEVQLDQTLFVLLPVVLFAVLGAAFSIYVAANSGDALSQAWDIYEKAISSPAGTKNIDPDVCRGICSTQDADLPGLKLFMDGLAGK